MLNEKNNKNKKKIFWWDELQKMMKNRYQNLTESALPDNSRGIVIFKKLFVSIKFSSPPFDVMFIELHDVQLHG